jgi:hypothetical protein
VIPLRAISCENQVWSSGIDTLCVKDSSSTYWNAVSLGITETVNNPFIRLPDYKAALLACLESNLQLAIDPTRYRRLPWSVCRLAFLYRNSNGAAIVVCRFPGMCFIR